VPTVNFINEQKSVFVGTDTTVLEAARRIGVIIDAPCNGMGTCGKCRVKAGESEVLACRETVARDVDIVTQNRDHENRTLKIVSGGKSRSYPLKPYITKTFDGEKTVVYGGKDVLGTESGDTTGLIYGVVADIGTTTLVTSLIDLKTGGEAAAESRLNPQSAYAQDVLSRIHFAIEGGLETLQSVLLDALNGMIDDMTRKAAVSRKYVYEAVYSGNTAMLHLACGIDPEPLGRYPYVSGIRGGGYVSAERLNISPFGIIYLPPVISAFVGPDITSGILASRLYEQKETVLFIDIGTNGEMALAKDGILTASSTAAGPAFEGMNIACGMRAGNGAVESFAVDSDGRITYEVIGGVKATGICGSGLLDIAGELVRIGIIGETGRFSKNNPSIAEKDGKKIYNITDGVYLAQNDVRQIQLAKGAIRTGIEALLAKLGISAGDVDRVEIAGSFGYHLNERSLIEIGLLPAEFADKVTFVGNTAQSGGAAFLLNADFKEDMKEVAARVVKVELSDDNGFEKLFVSCLDFQRASKILSS